MAGPDGLGNPLLHLLLGQIARRQGDEERALDESMRAHMGDGEDDPEDLVFLRARVRL